MCIRRSQPNLVNHERAKDRGLTPDQRMARLKAGCSRLMAATNSPPVSYPIKGELDYCPESRFVPGFKGQKIRRKIRGKSNYCLGWREPMSSSSSGAGDQGRRACLMAELRQQSQSPQPARVFRKNKLKKPSLK
jgi:hypothetical protein